MAVVVVGLSVRSRLRRLPRQVAARLPALGDLAATPTTPRRRPSAPASRRADFARDVAGRLEAHRAASGRRGLLVFAIDTELLGHWWWEGPIWLEEARRRAAGGRSEDAAARRRARRARAGVGGRSPRRPGARARTGAPGTRRRSPTSPGGCGAPSSSCSARPSAGPAPRAGARARRARAARAAVERLGVPRLRKEDGRLPLPACAGPLPVAVRGHRMRASTDPALRSLAPDLTPAPLLEP